MREFTYIIKDEHGVQARPAGLIASSAQGYAASISVECKEKKADAKRLLSLMSLGARCGDTLIFRIEGDDEAAAEEAMKRRCEEVI